jgi:hypothetical protein
MSHSKIRALILGGAALVVAQGAEAQLSYSSGQPASPAYEGFVDNQDGSYELVFGYMNKNWLEELDVPVGPDNYFSFTSPGGLDDLEVDAYDPAIADMGQPTHFLPRRNRFSFSVRVPEHLGDRELVWTLKTRGETRRAFATQRQDLLVDNMIIASETGALGAGRSDPETRSNVPPMIEIEGDRVIEARVGQPVTLVARVTDDGLPLTLAQRRERAAERREAREAADLSDDDIDDDSDADHDPADIDGNGDEEDDDAAAEEEDEEEDEEELSPELQALQRALREPGRVTVGKVVGLHYTWFVYRGTNTATFAPIQIKPWEDTRVWQNSPWAPSWVAPAVPEDGRWVVDVTFAEPGTYVLRGRADDGSLYADQEVTVNVTPLLN